MDEHDLVYHGPINQNRIMRELSKQNHSPYFRLKSIYHDKNFVEKVFKHFKNLPKFANLRCGLWYHPTFDETCYFKSTDGHIYKWDFSMSRLNLNLIKSSFKHCGAVIIDSTRRGKRFPDSFTKTVPIWAYVFNSAISMFKSAKFDNSYEAFSHSLPYWVPEQEKQQIFKKIQEEQYIEKLFKSSLDFEKITEELQTFKPLKCLWISTDNNFEEIDFSNTKHLDFIPIILVTASEFDQNDDGGCKKNFGWHYIQGAGDDHHSWSLGLTPRLFWEHIDKLVINCETEDECVKELNVIVSHAKNSDINDSGVLLKPNLNPRVSKHKESISFFTEISRKKSLQSLNLNLFIGNFKSLEEYFRFKMENPENIGHNFQIFQKILVVGNKEIEKKLAELEYNLDSSSQMENDAGTAASSNSGVGFFPQILYFWIEEHKQVKNLLFKNLETLFAEVDDLIENCETSETKSKNLLIIDMFGFEECVAVLVAILAFLERKMGIEPKKESIRENLLYSQNYIPNAHVTRSFMKQINRYLMAWTSENDEEPINN